MASQIGATSVLHAPNPRSLCPVASCSPASHRGRREQQWDRCPRALDRFPPPRIKRLRDVTTRFWSNSSSHMTTTIAADVSIEVVYLDDTDEVRAACGLPRTKRGRTRPRNTPCPLPRWTPEAFAAVNGLHRQISYLYPRMTEEMRQQIMNEANAARAVLTTVAGALADASGANASVHPDRRKSAEMHRMQAREAKDPSTVH